MNHIDQKLLELNEEILRKQKLRNHLKHLNDRIVKKKNEIGSLKKKLDKEHRDVLRIEKHNIYSFFAIILGTIEYQLEKEKQEYLHALMMYEGAEEALKSLNEEKSILSRSLNGLINVEKMFDKAVEEKDKLLKKFGEYPQTLLTANNRIANFNSQITELDAAIRKGNQAKKYLHKIILNLKTMEEWGFAGKNFTTRSMQRKTKATQKDIYTANNFLLNYEDQLQDLAENCSVNLDKEMQDLEAFLDRFVDSLITDWIVNNKINNSIHLVNSMSDNITKLNSSLDYHKSKVKTYLDEELDLKAELILELIPKNKS
ncbi:MAG: hypothetical protein P1U56_11900 [Saprospiraceae bacterium]|nr:hypothetical protein [Saprospiraceae bacterium]